MLGEQPAPTGEAAHAPGLGLVRAHRAGLTGPEAVGGEGAWRALPWKTEVPAHSGWQEGDLSPALLSALLCSWEGHQGTKGGVGGKTGGESLGAHGLVLWPPAGRASGWAAELGVWAPCVEVGGGGRSLISEGLSPREGRTGLHRRNWSLKLQGMLPCPLQGWARARDEGVSPPGHSRDKGTGQHNLAERQDENVPGID